MVPRNAGHKALDQNSSLKIDSSTGSRSTSAGKKMLLKREDGVVSVVSEITVRLSYGVADGSKVFLQLANRTAVEIIVGCPV